MNRPIITILLTMVCGLCCKSQTLSQQQLFDRLDSVIANNEVYTNRLEKDITMLKNELKTTKSLSDKYQIELRIYRKYESYQSDSAIAYLKRCIDSAVKSSNLESAEYCRTLLVKQLSRTGYYAESMSELNSIDLKALGRKHRRDFYIAANHLYGEMCVYSFDGEAKKKYGQMTNAYRDSIYATTETEDEIYYERRINDLVGEHKYKEALAMNDKQLKLSAPYSHEYAVPAYYRHVIYSAMNDSAKSTYWLTISAISDIENAVHDQASLWLLAEELYRSGHTQRAYSYISFAWDASQKFGTRIRNWQISPLLSNIDRNIQQLTRQSNARLTAFSVVVSLLSVLLIVVLIVLKRQQRRLKEVHGQLNNANELLSDTNAKLTNTNSLLAESNRILEEYVGRFMGLCTQNIRKTDNMRHDIARLLKARDYDALMRMARSTDEREKEYSEFYAEFDSAFLTLFPNFVDSFNALLREEERIQLSAPDRLNTPLRIYALIRLGIDNSQKIAEFLHHSLNTIYNYRARMRNAATGNRDEFEKKVKALCRIE